MHTWNQAVSRYQLTRPNRARSTLVRENALLRWLAPHLDDGALPLPLLTRGRCEDIRCAALAAGWGPTSTNHVMAVLRQVTRAAERWEWIPAAPKIELAKRPPNRVRWITRDEARRLVHHCPPLLGQMVRLSLATGLRKNTLRQLRWDWIDLDAETLHVPAKVMKARMPLTAPLSPSALAVLQERRGLHPALVFSNRADVPIYEPSRRPFREALRAAGIRAFTWHDLRHTWASWHVQGGTTLAELQQLGGWQSLEMVLRYAHLDTSTLRKAARAVSGI